jgi:hypothetical protein
VSPPRTATELLGAPSQQAAAVDVHSPAFDGVYPVEARPRSGSQTVAVCSLDSLALHLSMVGAVLAIAWCATPDQNRSSG